MVGQGSQHQVPSTRAVVARKGDDGGEWPRVHCWLLERVVAGGLLRRQSMRGCEPHALVEWTFGILDDCASCCLFRRRTTVARYGRRSACFTRVGHCLCCLISRWTGGLRLCCVCSTVGRSCETRGSASRSTTHLDRCTNTCGGHATPTYVQHTRAREPLHSRHRAPSAN